MADWYWLVSAAYRTRSGEYFTPFVVSAEYHVGDDKPFIPVVTSVNQGSDNAIREVGRDVRDFWRHLDMKFLKLPFMYVGMRFSGACKVAVFCFTSSMEVPLLKMPNFMTCGGGACMPGPGGSNSFTSGI